MKTKRLVAAAVLVAALASAAVTAAGAEPGPSVKTETLVQSGTAWNGKPYERYAAGSPQLTVLRMTIPAHASLPWHTHVMPNAAYIVSGHLTVEDRATGRKRTMHAGDAFNEQVGPVHRGFTDDEPCVVVVTYAGVAGMPASIPADGGRSDH